MKHLACLAIILLAGCNSADPEGNEAQPAGAVETSGKTDVDLAAVPPAVLAAAKSDRPDLTVTAAEAETRDGRRYFDIGGTLADGSEIELDIMEEAGRWRVVETQRDIAYAAAPEPVREAAAEQDAALTPTRVIESVQEDGVTIYEIYSPEGDDPQGRKLEIRWDGREAQRLTEEWAH